MLQAGNQPKKMPIVLYAMLLVIAIAAMIALKHCSTERFAIADAGNASGGDTIDVAIEYSPLSYYTYDDTLGGFHYDLFRLIAGERHVHFKFHPIVTLQKAIDGLNKGQFDIMAVQFPVTAANKQHYLFTEPVMLDRQVLVQRKDPKTGKAKVHSQLDLAGCTLHIVKGSPMKERIEGLSREIGGDIHIVVDDIYGPEQLFLQVASGEIDYAVINESIAASLAQQYNGTVDVTTAISFTQFQSWVLSKNSSRLCDSLNAWLKYVQRLPQFDKISSRYFPNYEPNKQ